MANINSAKQKWTEYVTVLFYYVYFSFQFICLQIVFHFCIKYYLFTVTKKIDSIIAFL